MTETAPPSTTGSVGSVRRYAASARQRSAWMVKFDWEELGEVQEISVGGQNREPSSRCTPFARHRLKNEAASS